MSFILRRFNRNAAAVVSNNRGKKVSRVEGRDRIRMFARHVDNFNSNVDQAKRSIGDEGYKELVSFIEDSANKISHVDLEARKVKYSTGI